MLNIKPMIELTNSEVKPIAAVRTTKQANEKMLSLLIQLGTLERLAILHTGTEARAREFLNAMMQAASQSVPRDILMLNVTPVIGTHVGPNGLGFASINK
jgi:fatty acid-binding protein DegV